MASFLAGFLMGNILAPDSSDNDVYCPAASIGLNKVFECFATNGCSDDHLNIMRYGGNGYDVDLKISEKKCEPCIQKFTDWVKASEGLRDHKIHVYQKPTDE